MVKADFFREVTLKEWSEELMGFVKLCNHGKLLLSKGNLFWFESIVFAINDGETRVLTVGVSDLYRYIDSIDVYSTVK